MPEQDTPKQRRPIEIGAEAEVLRNGAQVQAEPLTAYLVGQASQD